MVFVCSSILLKYVNFQLATYSANNHGLKSKGCTQGGVFLAPEIPSQFRITFPGKPPPTIALPHLLGSAKSASNRDHRN